ncbi:MAG: hypothetical protein E7224_05490 [Clostridiales bacterium]|nr:hypothetical protein [Clostridiales bacterium]
MQRMPPNYSTRRLPGNRGFEEASPALRMAERIRNEQGLQGARDYLAAMEPYLAPGERRHIAERLGVELPRPMENRGREENAFFPPAANSTRPPSAFGQSPFVRQEPFLETKGNTETFPSVPGLGNGGNPMQLLQMLGGMNPQSTGPAPLGQMNQLMQMMNLMQMLGGMNKKK